MQQDVASLFSLEYKIPEQTALSESLPDTQLKYLAIISDHHCSLDTIDIHIFQAAPKELPPSSEGIADTVLFKSFIGFKQNIQWQSGHQLPE